MNAPQPTVKASISEIEPAESSKSEERPAQQQNEGSEGLSYGYFPEVPMQEPKSSFMRDAVLVAAAAAACFLAYYYFLEDQQVWNNTNTRLWTQQQLSRYSGSPPGTPLHLALLGEVYDVTAGAKFYSEGGGYGFFTGRDASRAFVTGDFKGDLTDDVADLDPQQCLGLVEWREFYRKTYPSLGLLIGAFYDATGQPTATLLHVEQQAQIGREQKEAKERAEQELPGCNMRWSEEEGGAVWCDDGMYPRKVFQQLPGGQPHTRCACFKELGWSDYRQLYPDCQPDAHQCVTAPPGAA